MKQMPEWTATMSWIYGVVLLVTFASTAFARDDERGKWKPDDRGLAQRVAALEAALAATQAELAHLKKNTVLELNGKLTLKRVNGYPTAWFNGVNVQVVNGLGKTDSLNGAGNLIVGYNEPRDVPPGWFQSIEICSKGEYSTQGNCEANGGRWARNHKSGSHNIVGGYRNAYSSFGGLVVGERGAISQPQATVTAGFLNLASGIYSAVSGGSNNTASGSWSSASGGYRNRATGTLTSVSGGNANTASGNDASVSGGLFNTASGGNSSVSGGNSNTASGDISSISGGNSNIAGGTHASVSGGRNRAAPALENWAAGSLFQPN